MRTENWSLLHTCILSEQKGGEELKAVDTPVIIEVDMPDETIHKHLL
jgi:hypothetical protein